MVSLLNNHLLRALRLVIHAAVASAGFYYGWQMALLILGIMPFLIVAAWLQTKFTAGAHNKVTNSAAALLHHMPPAV